MPKMLGITRWGRAQLGALLLAVTTLSASGTRGAFLDQVARVRHYLAEPITG
jgi:hypothetical protein